MLGRKRPMVRMYLAPELWSCRAISSEEKELIAIGLEIQKVFYHWQLPKLQKCTAQKASLTLTFDEHPLIKVISNSNQVSRQLSNIYSPVEAHAQ
jgi:hypothetical protein